MKDSVKNHPLFTKALPLRQAYFQFLADGLAQATDNQDPQLGQLVKQVLFDTHLPLADVSLNTNSKHVADMLDQLDKPENAHFATTTAEIVIAMLAEQLPHPPEGL
ncbi:MAG: hypothetical protein EON60_02900 [Alphaproteobacteria bacterium]|nr:MAG: hypothetical protein EON60_02900 [Alphaproteobacteria bacterium]